jgi:Tn3 transposase DDE domain
MIMVICCPGQRRLEKLAATAIFALKQLKGSIAKAVEPVSPVSWASQLAANGPNSGESLLDWLRAPPGGFGKRDTAEGQDRIDALKRLGAAEIEIDDLPVERMRAHARRIARRIARRKASTLHKLKEPRRTVEIGCWLRLQLLELTDTILEQTSRRIGQLWAEAQRAVESRAVREIERYQLGIGVIADALDNPELSPEAFRVMVASAILPLREIAPSQSKLHSIRAELASAPTRLRAMLRQVGSLDLSIATGHPLNLVLTTLRKVYDRGRNGISAEDGNPFAPAAARLVSATSTAADRLAAYEVATGMLLKRCLRNGEASARHSVLHRSVADQLMSEAVWQKVRTQTSRAQGWPKSLNAYLKRFEPSLAEGLASLAEAVRQGHIAIDGERFRVPKLKAPPKDPEIEVTRKRLFAEIGNVQLPDIIVSVDERTRFSSVLPGRHAASSDDLESVYAGLLALGTEKTASEMARMLDGISEDRIELAMRRIEESGHLREANDLIASAISAEPLAALWGEGIAASADMMSLDATRHLWNARIEPRCGTHAVGTYTHVSDQWPIIYDRPILLNVRQAGAALEGAVEQKVIDLQRLAVEFRHEVHKLLSQGESVHQLQRTLMAGNIKAKQGRTLREITAVSGALSLLTNIVMLWNTQVIQKAVGSLPSGDVPEDHLAHIAPVAHRHINTNGKMRFALDDYAWLARPNIKRVAGG